MKVSEILSKKGAFVRMIKPGETIGNLARQLQQARIGVMVVSQDGSKVDGIISERDIAYSLADRRGDLHLLPVSALMTRNVVACDPEDSLSDVARLMTKHNIRHLPVKKDERLLGLISMRDIIAHRLDKLESKSKIMKSWFAVQD